MNFAALEKIDPDSLYDHLYTVYTEHRPREAQHLGYVDKSSESIDIGLARSGIDVTIRQSLSGLSSATQSSSTGFICWQTAVYFADWATAFSPCPLNGLLGPQTVVLELGAGVGALLASVLGPTVGHYVASDQAHVLKLMKENFANNVVSQKYTSTTSQKTHGTGPRKRDVDEEWSRVDFVELDWESPASGLATFSALTGRSAPDYVFACDTIYNTYLIEPFVKCVKSAMDTHTVAVVGMQLRDEAVTEEFLETVFREGLQVYRVNDENLSDELIEGFVVYCLRR
ncbi:hypothetical protein JCM33374_g4501 [Metschnikowia sp. JCM 33374]|nr:hypothetical protein JCM33374_g4501 [Metschnikowia sp. JCM 33374]